MDDILDEEDILLVYWMSWKKKSHFYKSCSRKENFSLSVVDKKTITIFPPVTCHRQLCMQTMTRQTNLCLSSSSFSDI